MDSRIFDAKKGEQIVIAVDGPAGSGKSSVCAQISRRLGWTYVNTGFLYRTIALLTLRRKIDLNDQDQVLTLVHEINQHLQWHPEQQEIWFFDENLAPFLHRDEIGQLASTVAKNAKVREALLPLQRRLALEASKPAILDGRDIGTVVFPDANLKIFLTASIEERARRRLQQLQDKDDATEDLERVKESLSLRDRQDEKRGTAPLKQAEDAILLDTSNMEVKEVVDQVIKLIRERGLC